MFNKLIYSLLGHNNKKIGVFYICTGKYSIFWERFYISAEKHFCPGLEKEYFVFTDQEISPKGDNVTIINQARLGWPFDTLMRFHLFNSIKEQALKCDYLYFFNANMIFLKSVMPWQIFPNSEEKIVVTRHPYYYEGALGGPFETNKDSTAYIDPKEAKFYVAGGLSGGIAKYYMEMGEAISKRIDVDLAKDIISVWWDESHLNFHYANNQYFKVLDPGYIVPENRLSGFPFKPYLVVLDKENVGGHEMLRG
jgi:hypothetical protein